MATNLWLPFSLQLDAGGNGTAEVGAPAMGYNWQAFVTFGTAPSGQSFTVSVLGQVVASGGRQSGPFAAGSGNTVTVTVSGGPASTTVNGVVQGAINQGVAAQAPLPSSGSLIEIAAGTIDATITGPVDANITNATLPVSGTIDLAPGTTVDASITNATLDVTGPVSITTGSQGNTGLSVQVIDERPTAVASIDGGVSLGNPLVLIAAPGSAKQLAVYKMKIWLNGIPTAGVVLQYQITGLQGGNPYVVQMPILENIASGAGSAWTYTPIEEDFGGLLCSANTELSLVMDTSGINVIMLGYVTYSVVG